MASDEPGRAGRSDRRSEDTSADRRHERGGGGIELAIAASSLLLVLFFAVGGLRIANTRSEVAAAARAGARAAASAYDRGEAERLASAVVDDALAERGVGCRSLQLDLSDDYRPGAVVAVTVRCEVDLGDVALVGFGRSETVEATAAEVVDLVRGGG